jgi:hypothetical protein
MEMKNGEWNAVKWSEVKISSRMSALLLIWVMQFVCGLLYSMLYHCCLLYVFCSLLCSNNSFYVFVILFKFVLFYIVSPHVYSFLCSICVQVYWPLPQGGNPISIKISINTPTNAQQMLLYNCLTTCFDPFGSSSGLYRIPKIIE